jgi:putative oxidoreductase
MDPTRKHAMNSNIFRLINPSTTGSHLVMLLMRVGFGGMMCYGHGWDKINKYGSDPSTFPMDPLNIGKSLSFYATTATEFACAMLVALGLMTRVACAPLIFAMCVAFFKVHGGKLTFVPNDGASEPAVMYLLAFAVIMLGGPGKFSLDQVFFGNKAKA